MASIACQHHVSWVIEVDPGIHQCIQCFERVEKRQITPRFDELPDGAAGATGTTSRPATTRRHPIPH